MGYSHLNYQKRCQILAFWKAGYTQTEIAKEIGVNQSTISRELNKNLVFIRTKLGSWQYKPDYAQGNARQRHKRKKKKIKLTETVDNFIREKLQLKWSPEQISSYSKKHGHFSIGKEWIYQFILKDKEKGGNLYLNLRHQHKKYRKRYGRPKRVGPIKNRLFISVLSITGDNGSEFAYHENISKELNTDFYFSHPYSSWERGLNENTNGLIRQYLKKVHVSRTLLILT